MPNAGIDIVVDRDMKQVGSHDAHAGNGERHRQSDHDLPAVRPHILHQPPRDLRVVDLA